MLDKNTIIGLVLIMAVFIGWGIYSSPSKEQKAAMKHQQDSMIQVQAKINKQKTQTLTADSLASTNDSTLSQNDSTFKKSFGAFASCSQGVNDTITVENDVFKVSFSSKGAIVNQVALKQYLTYGKKPVVFFDSNSYYLNLSVGENIVNTRNLYFTPIIANKDLTQPLKVSGNDSLVISFRAYAQGDATKYLEYRYTIRGNDYRVGYNIALKNLKGIVTDDGFMEMQWQSALRVQEKDRQVELRNSSIYYNIKDEVENLKETGQDDKKDESGSDIKWVSYRQQFFSTALIAKSTNFKDATMQTLTFPATKKDSSYLRSMYSTLSIPYSKDGNQEISMDLFYGPNKYNIISKYHNHMEQIMQLGWGFFLLQWINRFVIIPVFDFLSHFGWNMGIVILILTILVKIVLFPLAYKSYSSSAKMRVISPEVKKLNEKYPKQEQAMEKQKAMMSLYKRAGINPMAGCLPMILQFPILVAMFRFFPASIELRQQPFLWADDLSSYDSIINLPFKIPFYGSNVSLFCLLMTVAQIFYTKMTMKQQEGSTQMPGMKWMMYLMPVFMLFMLNQYSAALNYYYFISMCFTFIQVYVIQETINEDKILKRLKDSQGKPAPKSKWQKKMEAMEKRNRDLMTQRQKQQKRR